MRMFCCFICVGLDVYALLVGLWVHKSFLFFCGVLRAGKPPQTRPNGRASSPARVGAYKEWIRMGPALSPSPWDKAGSFYAHFNPYILGSHACGGAGAAKGRV